MTFEDRWSHSLFPCNRMDTLCLRLRCIWWRMQGLKNWREFAKSTLAFYALFSPFSMTRLFAQEIVVRRSRFFKENGVFQCEMSFCIYDEDTFRMQGFFYQRNVLIMSNTMELKMNIIYIYIYGSMMMFSPYHTMEVRSYCLLMTFVDVGKWYLVPFIHKRLHVHHIYNWKLQRMLHSFVLSGLDCVFLVHKN